jgi:hypothetical protein
MMTNAGQFHHDLGYGRSFGYSQGAAWPVIWNICRRVGRIGNWPLGDGRHRMEVRAARGCKWSAKGRRSYAAALAKVGARRNNSVELPLGNLLMGRGSDRSLVMEICNIVRGVKKRYSRRRSRVHVRQINIRDGGTSITARAMQLVALKSHADGKLRRANVERTSSERRANVERTSRVRFTIGDGAFYFHNWI